MHKELIDSFSTKDELISYAESIGITTLVKRRSLSNLKNDLTIKINQSMVEAITESEESTIKVVSGEENLVTVLIKREVHCVLPFSALDQFCRDNDLQYNSVLESIDKTWIKVKGFSFKKGAY